MSNYEAILNIAILVFVLIVLKEILWNSFAKLARITTTIIRYLAARNAGLVNKKGDLIGKAMIKKMANKSKSLAPTGKTKKQNSSFQYSENSSLNCSNHTPDLTVPTYIRNGKSIAYSTDFGYQVEGNETPSLASSTETLIKQINSKQLQSA